MTLGFRLCTYNHEYKDGPVHVHDRFNEVVGTLPAMTKAQGFELARAYAERHDWFDYEALAALAEEVLDADPN